MDFSTVKTSMVKSYGVQLLRVNTLSLNKLYVEKSSKVEKRTETSNDSW